MIILGQQIDLKYCTTVLLYVVCKLSVFVQLRSDERVNYYSIKFVLQFIVITFN